MYLITPSQAKPHGTPTVTVYEYDMPDTALGGALADIHGHYPEHGFVMNREVNQLVYVVRGSGEIVTFAGSHTLAEGDMLLLKPMEAFAWSGHMRLLLANAPKFTPEQYAEIA
jgi:hypothetical protein